MTDEVLQFIKKEKMILGKNHVIAGVSGGADSVALLLLLRELQQKLDFSLSAVHVEHGIRGEESREDARFVKELCEKLGVLCSVYEVNVPELAAKQGLGHEEAARILRYQAYENEVKKWQNENACEENKIRLALAHHADDNAETILFQMVRGSGLDGICGMKPQRIFCGQAVLIRPLLNQTREQIERYLEEQKQTYRTDSTNFEICYSRNRIRHKVLPELAEVNKQAILHINQTAEILRGIQSYMDDQISDCFYKGCIQEKEGLVLVKESMDSFPEVLRQEVIHKAICEAAGAAKDITSLHVETVRNLFNQQTGRRISLPYQLIAERIYEGIWIGTKENWEKSLASPEAAVVTAEQMEALADGKPLFIKIPEGKMRLQVLNFQGKMEEIHKKTYTKCLDYDKMRGGLQIRSRQSGDYLTVDEAGHTKRLKDFFINEKIPRAQRDSTLLLTQGAHVIWVVGHRISAEYKVKKSTIRILEVQIFGGKYHENQEN